MNTYITTWLNDNVNPVGSAVVVDKTLSIEGAAADAKTIGDILNINIKFQGVDQVRNEQHTLLSDLDDETLCGIWYLNYYSTETNVPNGYPYTSFGADRGMFISYGYKYPSVLNIWVCFQELVLFYNNSQKIEHLYRHASYNKDTTAPTFSEWVIDNDNTETLKLYNADLIAHRLDNTMNIFNYPDLLSRAEYVYEHYYRHYSYGDKRPVDNNTVLYDYIPVVPGEIFILGSHRPTIHICFFDNQKNFISGILSSYTTYKIIIPNNAFYISCSLEKYVRIMPIEYYLGNSNRFDHYFINKIPDDTKEVETYRNLINPDLIISDFYYNYTTGNGGVVQGWSAVQFPVKPNTEYYISLDKYHLAILSDSMEYITGQLNGRGVYTTPQNAAIMRFSYQSHYSLESIFIEQNGLKNIYTTFGTYDRLRKKRILSNIKTVGEGRDYLTIQAAIDAANEDDIILIYPGEYIESLKIRSKKVHLIGLNRTKTIIKYWTNDYWNPPIEMAKGSCKNLTIISEPNDDIEYQNLLAYCVHIDNINQEGEELIFENVDFINTGGRQCVGIGLRANSMLEFNNCYFESNGTAFLVHTWETTEGSYDNYPEHMNQDMIVKNCTIKTTSSNQPAIQIQAQELATGCSTLTFQRNIVISNSTPVAFNKWRGRSSDEDVNYLGSRDYILAPESIMNNVEILNYKN